MFNNIGKKIKGLAECTFIVEAIASIITGVFLAIEDDELFLLIALIGPVVAWISSWMLYGFGELIDQVCIIAKNTYNGEKNSESKSKVDAERMHKIERLRSQGLITEEEYQQAISKNK